MRKLLLIWLIALTPITSIANTASGTLSNFNFQVLSGTNPTLVPGSIGVILASATNSYALNDQFDATLPSLKEEHYSTSVQDGENFAQSYVNIFPNISDSSIFTSVSAISGVSRSEAQASFKLNYFSNTSILFSVDSTVTGTGNFPDEIFGTYGSLIVYAIVNDEVVDFQIVDHSTSNLEPSNFQNLSLSYTGSENATLVVTLYSQIQAFINTPVTAVPEPETYAMMLAGLGLMGFAARRRKN